MKYIGLITVLASLAFGQGDADSRLHHVQLYNPAPRGHTQYPTLPPMPTLDWQTKDFEKSSVALPTGFWKLRMGKIPNHTFINPLDPRADYRRYMYRPRGGLKIGHFFGAEFVVRGNLSIKKIGLGLGINW